MPSSVVPPLSAHIGFWLRMVSNHVSQAFAAKLAGQDVTVAEWSLMRTLHGKEPTPPSQIAEEMGMSRGAITRLADRLIAKALLVRIASTQDGRAQTLALTPKGTALVPVLAGLADRNDSEFFECLAADEREELIRLLMKLVDSGRMTALPVS
jgi:DNA-binding MarR family transcriptional regulator